MRRKFKTVPKDKKTGLPKKYVAGAKSPSSQASEIQVTRRRYKMGLPFDIKKVSKRRVSQKKKWRKNRQNHYRHPTEPLLRIRRKKVIFHHRLLRKYYGGVVLRICHLVPDRAYRWRHGQGVEYDHLCLVRGVQEKQTLTWLRIGRNEKNIHDFTHIIIDLLSTCNGSGVKISDILPRDVGCQLFSAVIGLFSSAGIPPCHCNSHSGTTLQLCRRSISY